MKDGGWRENEASDTHNLLDKSGKERTGRKEVMFLDVHIGRQKEAEGSEDSGGRIVLYTIDSSVLNTVPGS